MGLKTVVVNRLNYQRMQDQAELQEIELENLRKIAGMDKKEANERIQLLQLAISLAHRKFFDYQKKIDELERELSDMYADGASFQAIDHIKEKLEHLTTAKNEWRDKVNAIDAWQHEIKNNFIEKGDDRNE